VLCNTIDHLINGLILNSTLFWLAGTLCL